MSVKDWVWMPHPAHLCVSDRCRFFLSTYVNGYIISTVGEFFPTLESKKCEDIGWNRKYETMVFKSEKNDVKCCPWKAIEIGDPLEFEGYNCPHEARLGHMELCNKYETHR